MVSFCTGAGANGSGALGLAGVVFVFVFFTGEYCSWCQKQKDVLMEQDVLNSLKDHVICFVDLLERKDLAKKYNVKMVPAYFIIDSEEKLIKKHTGFKTSKDLISWIEYKGWFGR